MYIASFFLFFIKNRSYIPGWPTITMIEIKMTLNFWYFFLLQSAEYTDMLFFRYWEFNPGLYTSWTNIVATELYLFPNLMDLSIKFALLIPSLYFNIEMIYFSLLNVFLWLSWESKLKYEMWIKIVYKNLKMSQVVGSLVTHLIKNIFILVYVYECYYYFLASLMSTDLS